MQLHVHMSKYYKFIIKSFFKSFGLFSRAAVLYLNLLKF